MRIALLTLVLGLPIQEASPTFEITNVSWDVATIKRRPYVNVSCSVTNKGPDPLKDVVVLIQHQSADGSVLKVVKESVGEVAPGRNVTFQSRSRLVAGQDRFDFEFTGTYRDERVRIPYTTKVPKLAKADEGGTGPKAAPPSRGEAPQERSFHVQGQTPKITKDPSLQGSHYRIFEKGRNIEVFIPDAVAAKYVHGMGGPHLVFVSGRFRYLGDQEGRSGFGAAVAVEMYEAVETPRPVSGPGDPALAADPSAGGEARRATP